jgi:ATP-dependent DNA helicase RecG
MTPSKAGDTAAFITILNLESKHGYTNRAVIGGLDRFIKRCVDESRLPLNDSRLKQLLSDPHGYTEKNTAERKQWVDDVLNALGGVKKTVPLRNTPVPQRKRQATDIENTGPASIETLIDSPVTELKGVGENMAKRLSKLGVNTIRDIIYFFPRRFMDFSRKSSISSVVTGKEQTVFVNVWEAHTIQLGRMKSSEAVLGDETGNIRAVWFNQPWVAQQLKPNMRIALSGKVSEFNYNRVFENPEWELIEEKELVHTGRMVPVYQLTQGLFPRQTRAIVKSALDRFVDDIPDFLPGPVRQRCKLAGLSYALRKAHYPDDYAQQNVARQRLAFDELFLLQLGVLDKKREWQEDQPGHALKINNAGIENFISSLPFKLTGAQRKVIGEICNDLGRETPMSRLLQGDVGSGKTVVATIALLVALQNRYQGVLMAPTEILAEQHFTTIFKLLSAVSSGSSSEGNVHTFVFKDEFLPSIKVALLTGSLGNKDKTATHEMLKTGEIDIAIGTHALIQKGVHFKSAGLVIIDEQHRFGVLQRQALRQKGFNPHLLVMTATPIPRTLALTLYGDLDISTINEMPPGRQTIKTRWLKQDDRERAYQFIRKQVREGRQAFIICPLIEESENLEVKAAVAEHERLSREIFPDMRLGLLHGKLKGIEKESVMHEFKEGKLDILISTSVVEVGIDVPNATMMLVEAADRFGLAQLHQFRGRVGRGEKQSYCLLLAENPSEYGQERLKAIEEINDGFLLAEKDLQLRGPGEFFGTRQSGMPDLKMARLTDVQLLETARREASILFQIDPDLSRPENAFLAREYNRIWHKSIENN